jgi:hypothetical protein
MPSVLDNAFRLAARNFSTLFLFVAAIALPLHFAHSAAFRNVIEVAELHQQIEGFSQDERVRGVGPADLTRYRAFGLALAAIQLALLPAFVRGTERVIRIDADGGLPTTVEAFRGAWGRSPPEDGARRRPHVPTVLAAAAFALLLGWILRRAGLLVVSVLSPPVAFVGVGAVEALARAAAAPWFLVAASRKTTAQLR